MNTVTKLYQVSVDFEIEPIWIQQPPQIRICMDNQLFWEGPVPGQQKFQVDHAMSRGTHQLSIEYYGKSNRDSEQGLRIKNIKIGNISSPRFIWQGRYRPRYPEPWATQQHEQGVLLQDEIGATDYLGWNGRWYLDFTVPVFTWIHAVENLGWIYD